MELNLTLPFQAHVAKLRRGWADEASPGTHPDRERRLTRLLKKGFPTDQEKEGVDDHPAQRRKIWREQ